MKGYYTKGVGRGGNTSLVSKGRGRVKNKGVDEVGDVEKESTLGGDLCV